MKVCGLDPNIINNICDTEENGTTTCIKIDVDNVATRVKILENTARFQLGV